MVWRSIALNLLTVDKKSIKTRLRQEMKLEVINIFCKIQNKIDIYLIYNEKLCSQETKKQSYQEQATGCIFHIIERHMHLV